MRPSVVVLAILTACGGHGSAVPPDGETSDAPPDAGFPACHELASTPRAVPMHMTGTLAGADLEAPLHCATVDAPYGVETDGPDAVVPIEGLVPGQTYVVHLTSTADLGFYVVTGCDTASGPSDTECLLFEDAQPTEEVGSFVAPSSTVYVVVDYYKTSAPADATFGLDVYPQTCTQSAQCGGATPACVDGECVECVTSFDCSSPTAPVCEPRMHTCVAGVDGCSADDAGEPANDGPAGATVMAIDGLGHGSVAAEICSMPSSESDFIAFDVTTVGETWTVSLAWTGSPDLDMAIFDATGNTMGLSFWEQPESIELSYLPVGRYYIEVTQFAPGTSADPVSYTVNATRTLGTGCTTTADCAADYRNQLYRGSCDAGACVRIDGNGMVPTGGACDSTDDCAAGRCPSFFFVANADTREVCEPTCSNDVDCGHGFVCTTYLTTNFCVAKCTDDEQCPTLVDEQPATGPWSRLTCDVASGRCQ
ncbi:MAG TPA: hypothetical protein VGO00_01030 [Kofleriaceae bacterium]|nr:hypothetical protein [Kofleriaceae bacterium]